MFFEQKIKVNYNKHSVINPTYRAGKDTGMIGIYSYANCRIIYIESGLRETKKITQYE